MGTVEQLLQFHAYVNSTHVNLKLSLDYSKSEINFLNGTGKIHTSIFRKSSDRNTILRADSFHPSHLISNIPIGHFQKLWRICDTDKEFEEEASLMTERFRDRGYADSTLAHAYSSAKSATDTLSSKKKSVPKGQVRYISLFNTVISATKLQISSTEIGE